MVRKADTVEINNRCDEAAEHGPPRMQDPIESGSVHPCEQIRDELSDIRLRVALPAKNRCPAAGEQTIVGRRERTIVGRRSIGRTDRDGTHCGAPPCRTTNGGKIAAELKTLASIQSQTYFGIRAHVHESQYESIS